MSFRRATLALALCLNFAAAGGCASNWKKEQTIEANQKWNAARAGVLVNLAKQQLESGNLDGCRKSLDDAAVMDPKNPAIFLLSGKLGIEQAKLEQAEMDLKKARELDPKNAEAFYLSGVVFQRWQKPDIAYTYYVQASDLQPAELAYVLAKAEMLVAMDRRADALSMLREKVGYFENSAAIRDAVGQLLAQSGKWDDACEMLRQANILLPEEPTIREHLALALYFAHKCQDASAVLSKMVGEERWARRADLFDALGNCLLQSADATGARAAFESAAQIDPASPSAWLNIAKASLQLGDLKRADSCLRRAAALAPDSAETALMTGYLRMRQGRNEEAIGAFRRASGLDGSDTVSVCMVGLMLEKTGHKDAAMAYYAKALRMRPNDDLASKLMATIRADE